jgi:hypothetical protein
MFLRGRGIGASSLTLAQRRGRPGGERPRACSRQARSASRPAGRRRSAPASTVGQVSPWAPPGATSTTRSSCDHPKPGGGLDRGAIGHKFHGLVLSSSRLVAAVFAEGLFAVEAERPHHRQVGQAEQAGVVAVRGVDMLVPGPGGHAEDVVLPPVEALAVDDECPGPWRRDTGSCRYGGAPWCARPGAASACWRPWSASPARS